MQLWETSPTEELLSTPSYTNLDINSPKPIFTPLKELNSPTTLQNSVDSPSSQSDKKNVSSSKQRVDPRVDRVRTRLSSKLSLESTKTQQTPP